MAKISEKWLIILAFAAIYILWGSTYLFNYLAMQTIPPFLMLGSRFLVAGLILYAWGSIKKAPTPTWVEWRNSILIGVLFLAVGTGAVIWAMNWIDTGMSALLVAFDPLLIMFFLWVLIGQKPAFKSILGAGISIIGMALLIDQPQFTNSSETRWALFAVFVALISWAIASIYVSRIQLPASRLRASAIQMIGGGTVLVIFSIIQGGAFDFSWDKISAESAWSWAYLVVFGSIIAFSSFNYLLVRVSPEKVATSTYVNPIVALILGWAINDEIITSKSILAGVIMLIGVFLINAKEKKQEAHENS